MENRRVVVTGMGTISPIGHHARAAWESMKAGKNGIGPITLFDTTNYKTKLAAEVKDFDPREYLEVNDVLRTDRSVQFAAAAAGSRRKRNRGNDRSGTLRGSLWQRYRWNPHI